jgi:uncharacterized protein YgiM (DUF1202 family)
MKPPRLVYWLPLFLLLICACQATNDTNSNSSSLYTTQTPQPTPQATVPQPVAEQKTGANSDAVVISTKANLRETPKASGQVLTELEQGEQLSLVQQQPVGAWYKVRHLQSGKTGWVHGNTIKLTSSAKSTSSVTQESNSEASTSSSAPPRQPTTRAGRSADTYTNVDGVEVPRPRRSATIPAGATARCADGTYSFSRNHRGTCSHHGGVAEWLD